MHLQELQIPATHISNTIRDQRAGFIPQLIVIHKTTTGWSCWCQHPMTQPATGFVIHLFHHCRAELFFLDHPYLGFDGRWLVVSGRKFPALPTLWDRSYFY
jgi:hypothetical protein